MGNAVAGNGWTGTSFASKTWASFLRGATGALEWRCQLGGSELVGPYLVGTHLVGRDLVAHLVERRLVLGVLAERPERPAPAGRRVLTTS